MDVFDVVFENYYTLCVRINWILAIFFIFCLLFIIKIVKKKSNSVKIDQVTLGIGDNSISFSYDIKDREIAYKLWVEMNTRKIGNVLNEDDVIIEVYDSWYSFFQLARELLKEVPIRKVKQAGPLIDTTTDILNKGLRPHLTKWQSKFRKWFSSKIKDENNDKKTPQEIQKEYPYYIELIKELNETNKKLLEYKDLLKRIAFSN